jgi:predicted Zn-dependent protease
MFLSRAGKSQRRVLRIMFVLGVFLMVAAVQLRAQASAQQLFDDASGLLDHDQFAEAVAAYGRCLAEDPHFVEALFNRALASEMVDRQEAIEDWKAFVEAASGDEDLKWDVARARARIQLLESMPALPAVLQPAHYVAKDGDYYDRVAGSSDGAQWKDLPVKVYLGSSSRIEWQEGAREAFDIWSAVFPLQLVAEPGRADIRIGWEESLQKAGQTGEETDWVRMEREGNKLSGRRVAIITLDLSRRWSKDEMRAIMLHEFGHALGLKGHSDRKKDIMYFQMQEKRRQIPIPMLPTPVYWKSLVKQPSQRDINTLIRLYNSAGYLEPLD